MTLPDPSILVYFGLEYAGTGYAVYDDPVRGIYDDAVTIYAPVDGIGVDVTGDGFGISVRRGRSRELDEFEAGTATVAFHNFDRTYDNLNAAGIYFGDLVPGKRVELQVWGVTIYAGTIEDWNLEWTVDGVDTAGLVAVDALGVLARKEFDAWTTTAGQTSGLRLASILDRPEVGFGSNRDLAVGNSTLQADSVTWGSNVLAYCQLVNRSEAGRLFASRDNLITHQDRYSLTGTASVLAFSDNGAGTEFHGVTTATGSEFLYNRVGVDREGGTLQTVEDGASGDAYGIRSLSLPGLLMDSDTQSADMAQYLLGRYKDPATRVASITVKVHGLPEVQRGPVAGLDLGDLIAHIWTPQGVGDQLVEFLVIEGVEHQVTVDEHVMTVFTSPHDSASVAVYDDTVVGVYDSPLAVYAF
jgi:hypothetical protein